MNGSVVVVVLCAVVGYVVVSYLMSRGSKDAHSSTRDRGDQESSGDTHSNHSGRRHEADGSTSGESSSDSPTPSLTWFEILGVAASSSAGEVTRAYRIKISQYHPDKVSKLGLEIRQLAETRSKEINSAYDEWMRLRRGRNRADA